MSYAETTARLVKALRTEDPDFLSTFINDVVAVGDLGEPSDNRETNFSNGRVAKAMLAAQYTAMHAVIMRVARLFTRIIDLQYQDMIGRLLSSLQPT
jgi:hypothetical protein